jgi:hypothetical protein
MRLAPAPGDVSAASWQSYATTLTWVAPGSVVYVQFRDQAGNPSLIYGSDGSAWERVCRAFLPLVLHDR